MRIAGSGGSGEVGSGGIGGVSSLLGAWSDEVEVRLDIGLKDGFEVGGCTRSLGHSMVIGSWRPDAQVLVLGRRNGPLGLGCRLVGIEVDGIR